MQLKTFILSIIFCLIAVAGIAQPADPATDPDNPVPITGIEILLGIGALLGARKVYKERKGQP